MLATWFSNYWFLPPLLQAIGLVLAIQLPWYLPIRFDHWDPRLRYVGYGLGLLSFVILYNFVFPDGIRYLRESLELPDEVIFSSEEPAGGRLIGIAATCINLVLLGKWGDPETRSNMLKRWGPAESERIPFQNRVRLFLFFFSILSVLIGIPQFFSNSAFTQVDTTGIMRKDAWDFSVTSIPLSAVDYFEKGVIVYVSGPSQTGKISSSGGGRVTVGRITLILKDRQRFLVRESSQFDREWFQTKLDRLTEVTKPLGLQVKSPEGDYRTIAEKIDAIKIELQPIPSMTEEEIKERFRQIKLDALRNIPTPEELSRNYETLGDKEGVSEDQAE